MIPRFSDHAANERTYFSWVRTGISILAFGFVLERFSLFLQTVSHSLDGRPGGEVPLGGREAGIVLVVAGLLTLLVGTWRFAANAKRIESEKPEVYGLAAPLVLGGLVFLLGLLILGFVLRATAGL